MLSIFATRRDRPTTSRRARHARPQVEGLEEIIALDGASWRAAFAPHAVVANAKASSIQTLSQTGSDINLQIEGNRGPVLVVIEANTINFAVQNAKNTGTATTVFGKAYVPGHKFPIPVALQVTNAASASSNQSITQKGSTVNVTIANNKGSVDVGIVADTVNNVYQTATNTAAASVTG